MSQKSLFIKASIEQMIETQKLRVGEKLPSEIEMAKQFGVSRETFRAAVKLLEQEGKLLVKHGVGTFIIKPLPSVPSSLEKLSSTGAMVRAAGMDEGERRDSLRMESCADKEWCGQLGLKEGEKVVVIERLRTVNGEPAVYSVNVMPHALTGEAFNAADNFSGSLFQHLEKSCGIYIVRAHTEIRVPLHIDPYCQKLLVRPETTVLQLKQLHYDEANRPVLYSLDYMRNDIFQFWIQRKRE
ncbi:GntR family transcriptional regulator [Paenibacillus turpanensis]|uniref:GntR family transcriptional regulator n=1 Tax=Paenibacillus turpanensis TaxID=2689078 RepID=UPI00140C172E|nr:GntR family transcriptional regulator [Paenibacillus turpanensis]